jgi:hypothetical protein
MNKCSDCHVDEGCLHEIFCTKEICPFCGGQLASCDCIVTVLELNENEKRLVYEYIDDSVQPLKGIIERWVETLEKKGRIPFVVNNNERPKMVSYEVVKNLEDHIEYRDELIGKLEDLIKGSSKLIEQTLKTPATDKSWSGIL